MANNRKSILLIGNFLSKSASTRGICEDLRAHLLETGWDVYYASTRRNKLLRLFDMAFTVISYKNKYCVANIDVFSGNSFFWAEVIASLLAFIHKPYVCTLRGGNLGVFAKKNPQRVSKLLLNASIVTTPSQYLKNELQSICNDIVWLPNAISVSSYPDKLRKVGGFTLVWLRAFHHIYNPSMALEVLRDLIIDFPNLNLLMIGPDKQDGSFKEFEQKMQHYSLSDHVLIAGGVPKTDVPQWLNQGDMFLNTTRIESFGVSVLEAAACGLPIVTTDAGELPYLWNDGQDALIVPVDNSGAMATAVRRILTEPGLAEKLSTNARRKAEQFDWSVILPQWETLLAGLILHD